MIRRLARPLAPPRPPRPGRSSLPRRRGRDPVPAGVPRRDCRCSIAGATRWTPPWRSPSPRRSGPYHNGLAGGGFALLSLQGKDTLALDFREVAPAAASRDMFLRDGKPVPAAGDRRRALGGRPQRGERLPRAAGQGRLAAARRRPRSRHPARPRGPGGDPQVPTDGDRPPRVPPARSGGVAHLPPPRTRRTPRGARPRHPPAPAGARPYPRTHRRLGRGGRSQRTHRPLHRPDGPRRAAASSPRRTSPG